MGMSNEDVHDESFVNNLVKRCASLKNFQNIKDHTTITQTRAKKFNPEKFKRGSAKFTKWLGKEIFQ